MFLISWQLPKWEDLQRTHYVSLSLSNILTIFFCFMRSLELLITLDFVLCRFSHFCFLWISPHFILYYSTMSYTFCMQDPFGFPTLYLSSGLVWKCFLRIRLRFDQFQCSVPNWSEYQISLLSVNATAIYHDQKKKTLIWIP